MIKNLFLLNNNNNNNNNNNLFYIALSIIYVNSKGLYNSHTIIMLIKN